MSETTRRSANDPATPIHGPITPEFLAEVRELGLRFLCEQCEFFDTGTEKCVHGYPNEPHREGYFEGDLEGRRLVFCREFEMT